MNTLRRLWLGALLLGACLLSATVWSADLVVTAANVVPAADAIKVEKTAGATITAGQLLYVDTNDNGKVKLAQSDGTALEATVYGIALNGASNGQPIIVQTGGSINPGATVVVGRNYVLSTVAGSIAASADPVSTNYVTYIGVGTSSSNIKLGILVSGVQVP